MEGDKFLEYIIIGVKSTEKAEMLPAYDDPLNLRVFRALFVIFSSKASLEYSDARLESVGKALV